MYITNTPCENIIISLELGETSPTTSQTHTTKADFESHPRFVRILNLEMHPRKPYGIAFS